MKHLPVRWIIYLFLYVPVLLVGVKVLLKRVLTSHFRDRCGFCSNWERLEVQETEIDTCRTCLMRNIPRSRGPYCGACAIRILCSGFERVFMEAEVDVSALFLYEKGCTFPSILGLHHSKKSREAAIVRQVGSAAHRRRSRTDLQKVYFHHELFATDFRSNNYSRLNK